MCPQCGHRNTFVTQSNMRWRGCIAGALCFAIGCFLLALAVFASFLFGNKPTPLRDKDVAGLVLLYGLSAVFLIGGISIAIGGGRWFIRYMVSLGRHGGSGVIR